MVEGAIAEFDQLFEDVEVDQTGVVRLEGCKDTPLWNQAEKLLPGARSIIVLALEVFPEVVKYLTSERRVGEIALRELYNRHMQLVNGQLDWEAYRIVKKLHRLGFKGISSTAGGAPTDERFLEGVLSHRHAAQVAGLGVIGWHSLLITPDYGARVRLAVVVTDAPLESAASVAKEIPCLECGGACIKICPVRAITRPRKDEQYKIDKYTCSTYYNASGGCSECLKVCPAG